MTTVTDILKREAERHPEWADTLGTFLYPKWYRERLEQEPKAADYCVVASEFCRQSLLRVGVNPAKIKLLPLGADLQDFPFTPRVGTGAFRVLFVGGVSQHKGIKYLLEAYQRIRGANTQLVLVGPVSNASAAPLAKYGAIIQCRGRLDQCDVIAEMKKAHVLVLPSLSEGFGLVIPEAMATGMPVIASNRSIGPELIREGQDGFVLEPDDIEGLAAKLEWLATHRSEACRMGQEAAQRAALMSWDAHAQRVREILQTLASNDAPRA